MGVEGFDRANYEDMGPTLLSMQPSDPKPPPALSDDWPEIYQHVEATLQSLRMWRWSWWSHWARVAEFFKPRRYNWLVTANRMNRGSPINDNIIDGTPTLALNTLAAGMWSGFTNPSEPWLAFEPKQPGVKLDQAGQQWLEDLGDLCLTILAEGNFYDIMAQAFEDLGLIGTAPIICYEDYYDVCRFYLPCAGEYMLKTGARFSTDTLYREFTLTVQQIVEMFGVDVCPADVQKFWNEAGAGLQTEFIVAHAIEPNFELAGRGRNKKIRVVPGVFTYRELYWLRGREDGGIFSRKGFHTKPFATLLWSRVSNDAYARSPCMDALGDNKQVQRSTIRKGEFIEKLVRPPMGANPELKSEPSSILPGMTTYTSTEGGKKGFYPLFEVNPTALAPLVADIEAVDKRIEKALFVDVFMAITQMQGVEPRNELELTKRDMERLQKLGPVVNLVTGALSDIVERVVDIATRRGLVAPQPRSLRGIKIKPKFDTIMHRAIRAAKSVAMKDTFVTAGQLSEAAIVAKVPSPIRKLNLDKALEEFAIANRFPADCVYTDDEVRKHDQARMKAVQQAAQPGQAMAAVEAAKSLSQTPTGPGTALSGLLGQAGGGGAAPAPGP